MTVQLVRKECGLALAAKRLLAAHIHTYTMLSHH